MKNKEFMVVGIRNNLSRKIEVLRADFESKEAAEKYASDKYLREIVDVPQWWVFSILQCVRFGLFNVYSRDIEKRLSTAVEIDSDEGRVITNQKGFKKPVLSNEY